MKKTKVRKKSTNQETVISNAQDLQCSICGEYVFGLDSTIKSVKCGRCVQLEQIKTYGMPTTKKTITKKSTKPAGWHWMGEFVDTNGDFYKKGKLITEKTDKIPTIKTPEYIQSLEDKKTELKNKPKLSKYGKQKQADKILLQIRKTKKEIKKYIELPKSKTIVKKFEAELKRLKRQLKKVS